MQLDPNKSAVMARAIKDAAKNVLEKSWASGIKEAYKKYGKEIILREITRDLWVQKVLWRSLLWAASVGWLAASSELSQGNYGKAIKEWLIWWIWWAILGNLATKPTALLQISKYLDKAWVAIKRWAAAIPNLWEQETPQGFQWSDVPAWFEEQPLPSWFVIQ